MVKNPFRSWPPKPRKKTAKAPKPQKPKNTFEETLNKDRALRALSQGVRLSLTYDGLHRVVEVHTVGETGAGRPAMSVYQVDGQSHEQPATGWRLMCFDECFDVAVTNLPSSAPRPDYRKRAKQFSRIDAEV